MLSLYAHFETRSEQSFINVMAYWEVTINTSIEFSTNFNRCNNKNYLLNSVDCFFIRSFYSIAGIQANSITWIYRLSLAATVIHFIQSLLKITTHKCSYKYPHVITFGPAVGILFALHFSVDFLHVFSLFLYTLCFFKCSFGNSFLLYCIGEFMVSMLFFYASVHSHQFDMRVLLFKLFAVQPFSVVTVKMVNGFHSVFMIVITYTQNSMLKILLLIEQDIEFNAN